MFTDVYSCWQLLTAVDSCWQLLTAVDSCLHRRTAHALDELHTWDLGHKKGYRKAKPFYLKCLGVVQRWHRDNHNMKRTSYLVISPHETTSWRRNVPQCRWNVFFSPSQKHGQLENGSTFSPRGGGRSPRWAGVSLGGRDPLSSFPRCALQTESGTQYCTLRHSKSQIWHFFRGQILALFGSKS